MTSLDDRAGLTGKLAVIIGGGGGLGRACTLDLARAGVRVALCDKDEALLDETVAEVGDAALVAEVLDARDAEALAAFLARVDDAGGGGLDVLVNVVGGTFRQDFADSRPSVWDSMIRTNFTWLLHATHLSIPRLRRAGGGSIVNVTSIEGHRAAPGYAVYGAMKAAVESFTRSLAVELGPEAIRVNTIAPDLVPTEGMMRMVGGVDPATWADDPVRRLSADIAIPMGRVGTYDDVGGCVLFLASDLSRYVTGTTLHVDGGTRAASGWWRWPDGGYSVSPPPSVVERLLDDP